MRVKQDAWNWRIDTVPGSPTANMAVDALLLAHLAAAEEAPPTVRIYTWDRPAVSIGRLQSEEPVREHYPHLPIVRRPTGGRAVVHGNDLTISVAARLEQLPADSRSILASHHFIVGQIEAALRASGVEVCFGGCAIGSQRNILDCFELSAACDLIDSRSGAKIVGSAQRREGTALLQQMSLPGRGLAGGSVFLQHLHRHFEKIFARTSEIDT